MWKNNSVYKFLWPKESLRLPPREDGWYGRMKVVKGDNPPDDTTVRPFHVDVPQQLLDDLQTRLKNAKYSDAIDSTDFRYGFNAEMLKKIVAYWQGSYNWRRWEKDINRHAQFITQIEGIDIHFVHVKPKNPCGVVLPLIAIHGWPGSFYEYHKALDELVDSNKGGVSFEVVVPSIPGYGFSEAPKQEGFSVVSAARIFVKLMKRLGYNQFFVHGGDWGSVISKTMVIMYPESIRGLHTNLIIPSHPRGVEYLKHVAARYAPMIVFRGQEAEERMYNELQKRAWSRTETGYYLIQSTKPDTVGAALIDSPVGLAAYLLEKFSSGTNIDNINKADGGLEEKFSLDELLTNVMIYWISGNVTSSLRFYKENAHPLTGAVHKYHITQASVSDRVPAAYAVFPNEIVRMPRFMAQAIFPRLVQYTIMPRGGHFAAFEEPQLLADDIKRFAGVVVAGIK